MIDFKLPVDLPAIDLSTALPLAALVLLAALILTALLACSIVRSKLVVIALIVALVMGGSSVIVGGLQALTGLVAVAGLLVIACLVLIARQPVLLDLTREMMRSRPHDSKPTVWPPVIDQPTWPQLPPSRREALPTMRHLRSKRLPRHLGF